MRQRLHQVLEKKKGNVPPTHLSNKSTKNDHNNPTSVRYRLYFTVFLLMHGIFFVHQYFRLRHHNHSDDPLGSTSPTLSDIQLFVPTFPGGFWELNSTCFRTLQFFWSQNELDVVVILDDTVYEDEASKEIMNNKVISFFKSRRQIKNITVAYNPRSDKNLYGGGWYMQQLIMFWADNFTDAPYIGFFDDDTAFTKAVQVEDLFDEEGRPRAIVRYPNGIIHKPWIPKWFESQSWAFGGTKSYIFGMSYFPVVVKREHLENVREAILNAHPEFSYFDEFFMTLKNRQFSQFGMMFDYFWQHHREEYSWHFDSFPYKDSLQKFPFISQGPPEENGVTKEMLRPFPRVTTHVNYMTLNKNLEVREQRNRDYIVSKIMKQGYCFSLPLVAKELTYQTSDKRCSGYDIWNDMNIKLEWAFEEMGYGLIWPKYDPNSTLVAHQQRILKNRPHQWDQEELSHLESLPSEMLA